MSEGKVEAKGGIGLGGLLTVLFIGLKLTHYIDWSWVWVLSPLWLPLSVVIGVFLVLFVGTTIFRVVVDCINQI